MQGVSTALAPGVVRQEGARHAFRPPRFAVLAPVADVDDPEQVAPAGGVVYAHQQFTEEQVLVGGGSEQGLEHVAPKEPASRVRREVVSGGHARSIKEWRSSKARSLTSWGKPARSSSLSSSAQISALAQSGQAARRSATDRG